MNIKHIYSIVMAELQGISLTLLCSVSEPSCSIWARGAGGTVNRAKLAVLPSPDTLQEAHHIGLLLAVKFLNVFVRAHDF